MRVHLEIALLVACCLGQPTLAQGNQTHTPPAKSSLDLPISPVRFGDKLAVEKEPEIPVPDDDSGEDPKDTPPPIFYGEELVSETDTIYYVIDASGSMSNDFQVMIDADGNLTVACRFDRAVAELARSISGLSENFEFNIIAYSCSTNMWRPSMQEATVSNKTAAITWARGISPGGSTGTGPAVALALNERENMMVVLLTDGSPNCGAVGYEGHRLMIRGANAQGAAVNVFGISAIGPYRAFCQGVASDNGGQYFDVP